jgi:multidrug efflux pump subunit AcrB
MTSLAFILGVVPLYIASGASAASQKEIGTGVFWGMVIGTPISVFLVPVFFVACSICLARSPSKTRRHSRGHRCSTGRLAP